MFSYFVGFCRYLFYLNVSKFSLIDKHSKIDSTAKVFRNTKLFRSHLGSFSYIAPGTELTCCYVGKFCSIGRDCLIGLPYHPINFVSTSPIFYSLKNVFKIAISKENKFIEYKDVTIGHDVWIGSRVIIQGGVRIGNGVIIGAGAVVTKDIPDYGIAVGVPAKVIKYRFDSSTIDILNSIKWWDKDISFYRKHINLFSYSEFNSEDLLKLKGRI